MNPEKVYLITAGIAGTKAWEKIERWGWRITRERPLGAVSSSDIFIREQTPREGSAGGGARKGEEDWLSLLIKSDP